MAIKFLIDSASDISKIEAENMGIEIMPMLVNFGNEEYYDGVDLLPEQFYEKLTTNKNHPKTSQVTPYRFSEAFERLTANGDEVIAICLSSKLSGTFEAAKQAAEKFKGKVFAVDSLSASVGERLLLQYALRLVEKGMPASAIANELDSAKLNLHVMAALDTLTYLKKGGRISATVAFVGGALKIKPVVALIDGEVKMVGKAIGTKRSHAFLTSYAESKGGINFDMPYCILWSGTDGDIAKKYATSCDKIFGENKNIVSTHVLGSTIGTHVGPGIVGLAFFGK